MDTEDSRRPQAPDTEASFQRFSTDRLHRDQRFEYWRHLHPGIRLDVPQGRAAAGYRAQLLVATTPQGVSFGWCQNDDTLAHFAQATSDFILISQTLTGEARLRQSGDKRLRVTRASGFVVVDGRQPLSSLAIDHSLLYLMLPCDHVTALAPSIIERAKAGAFSLDESGLTRVLRAHMTALAQEGERLDPAAAGAALRSAADMGMTALVKGLAGLSAQWDQCHPETLYHAARRLIEVRYADPGLDVDCLAKALGTSRTALYRAFSGRERSIAQTLRRVRMSRACALLACRRPPHVDRLAYECGYLSAASFARAFRREVGVTPSQYREQQWTQRLREPGLD